MTKPDIRRRSHDFSLTVIKICRQMQKNSLGKILCDQLLRSGTSIGANIEEAQAAQSKNDFLAKMSIARKEAHETHYWLRLIRDSQILTGNNLNETIDESEQLMRILSAIILSGKRNS